MSNLTPEVRTDKNGNAVTRWIRAHSKKKKPAIIPSPASAQEVKELRTRRYVNAMLNDIAISNSITMGKHAPDLFHTTVSLIMDDGSITDPPEDLIKAVTFIAYIRGLRTEKAGAVNVWAVNDGDPETRYKSAVYNSVAADAAYISDHLEDIIELIPELTARVAHERHVIELLLNSPTRVLRDGEL